MSIQQIGAIYSGTVVHTTVEVVTPVKLLHEDKILNSQERLWHARLFYYQQADLFGQFSLNILNC
jgi:hypothetical protein